MELGETGGRYIALQCTGAIVGYMRILIKVKQKKRQRPKMKKTKKKSNFGKAKKFGCATPCPFSLISFFYNGTVNLEISELLKKKQIGNKRPEDE